MSGKGNYYDNYVVETFIKTIKAELILRYPWEIRRKVEIFEYINGFTTLVDATQHWFEKNRRFRARGVLNEHLGRH